MKENKHKASTLAAMIENESPEMLELFTQQLEIRDATLYWKEGTPGNNKHKGKEAGGEHGLRHKGKVYSLERVHYAVAMGSWPDSNMSPQQALKLSTNPMFVEPKPEQKPAPKIEFLPAPIDTRQRSYEVRTKVMKSLGDSPLPSWVMHHMSQGMAATIRLYMTGSTQDLNTAINHLIEMRKELTQ